MKTRSLFVLFFLAIAASTRAFVNLDFEDGTTEPSRIISTDSPFPFPTWTADPQPTLVVLPGWRALHSDEEVQSILAYDEQAVDGPRFAPLTPGPTVAYTRWTNNSINRTVSMFARNVAPLPTPDPFPFPPDSGFQPVTDGPFSGPFSMAISQTGWIPENAASLIIEGIFGPNAVFEVSLGDSTPQVFVFADLWPGTGPSELSVKVSAFAGQEIDLELRQVNGSSELTGIRFLPIPEPSALSLFALAIPGCYLFLRRRRYFFSPNRWMTSPARRR